MIGQLLGYLFVVSAKDLLGFCRVNRNRTLAEGIVACVCRVCVPYPMLHGASESPSCGAGCSEVRPPSMGQESRILLFLNSDLVLDPLAPDLDEANH